MLSEFSIAPFPTYTYNAEDINVKKTIFMQRNKNSVSVIYKIINKNSSEAAVRIYPVFTCRHFHSVINRWNNHLDFTQASKEKEVQVIFHPHETAVLCHATDGNFVEKINPVEKLVYRFEAQRGEASVDNCFQPGYFELDIAAKTEKEFRGSGNGESFKSRGSSNY